MSRDLTGQLAAALPKAKAITAKKLFQLPHCGSLMGDHVVPEAFFIPLNIFLIAHARFFGSEVLLLHLEQVGQLCAGGIDYEQ